MGLKMNFSVERTRNALHTNSIMGIVQASNPEEVSIITIPFIAEYFKNTLSHIDWGSSFEKLSKEDKMEISLNLANKLKEEI